MPPTGKTRELGLASRAVHADDGVSAHRAVAPALHVSTTYAYARDPAQLVPNENLDVSCPFQGERAGARGEGGGGREG